MALEIGGLFKQNDVRETAFEISDGDVTAAKLNADIVGIDAATGKVTAINSTNFTSLDGANLTAIVVPDSAVTKGKLNVDIVGIDRTTGKITAINSTNFTSLDGSNLTNISGAVKVFESGTATLTTTAYVGNPVTTSINVAAADLTNDDILVFEVAGANGSDRPIYFSFGIANITTPIATIKTCSAGSDFNLTAKYMDDPKTANSLLTDFTLKIDATIDSNFTTADGGEASPLITAFTVQLKLYYDSEANQTSLIKYKLYAIKS